MAPTSFAILFQQLRWRTLCNSLRVLREQALLRSITILLCSLLVWGFIFGLSYHGYYELRYRFAIPLDRLMPDLDVLFLSLSALLIFSSGIILYSSLFAAAEANYLLSLPVPADHIFAYKLQGAMAFSSWAFVLLGSPVLIAYGLMVRDGASWIYYPSLLLFFLGFVLIPGALGGLARLLVVNLLPRHRKQVLVLVGLAMLLPLTMFLWQWIGTVRDLPFGSRDWFTAIFAQLAPASSNWLPSHWMARGLREAALGDWGKAGYYLALVWSNGLFLYVAATWLSIRLYRRGYNRMASGGTLRKKYGGQWMDRCLDRALFFLDVQTRLLFVKDFRTFRRDPAQWFQIFIFVQLSALYFYNMRQFYQQDIGRAFQNGISLLTLLAIAFLTCAYTGRFIYPMLSLEGRKFWILGLLPLNRGRLLWGKFMFSAVGTLITGEFLAIFSDIMLNMPWEIVVVHSLTIGVLACVLSGLSVGLGACMPNFRESDPSKIAVGLGGTLNLVAGLLALIVVICLMAGPWHLLLFFQGNLHGPWPWWAFVGFFAGALFGGATVLLALRAGAKTLQKMEF